jgi:hypothetical protein
VVFIVGCPSGVGGGGSNVDYIAYLKTRHAVNGEGESNVGAYTREAVGRVSSFNGY